jgi:hypothetical protein
LPLKIEAGWRPLSGAGARWANLGQLPFASVPPANSRRRGALRGLSRRLALPLEPSRTGLTRVLLHPFFSGAQVPLASGSSDLRRSIRAYALFVTRAAVLFGGAGNKGKHNKGSVAVWLARPGCAHEVAKGGRLQRLPAPANACGFRGQHQANWGWSDFAYCHGRPGSSDSGHEKSGFLHTPRRRAGSNRGCDLRLSPSSDARSFVTQDRGATSVLSRQFGVDVTLR